jgi:hypothetical protein
LQADQHRQRFFHEQTVEPCFGYLKPN